jgi:hypothetical protein
MQPITKQIQIQLKGDDDAVKAALVFDRPEVYRYSPRVKLH